jgi:hypothetical protein
VTDALLIARQWDERRRSRLFPASSRMLLHADLHNHTRLSDGEGWAEDAFASMRAAGLDVAAVTDHAYGICAPAKTIDDGGWRRLGKLADDADDPGSFVAIRGFEWSSPSLGHMNLWGSSSFIEPLPLRSDGVPAELAIGDEGPPDAPVAMAAFYEWLAGEDGLIGFNHPGRETGRFGFFRYDRRLAERMVALEMFNRDEDYLFERVDTGGVSPLVACLDAGWRVGLVGVTDEHRASWGFHEGLGRTGIWALGRDRAGVHEAMLRRRMFATRERDLHVNASANGVPMGDQLMLGDGDVTFELEIAGALDWIGRPLRLQVLQTGSPLPAVVEELDFRVPAERLVTCRARIDRDRGDWLVLRVSDPAGPPDRRAADFADYRSAGRTVAYLSPFFLRAQPGLFRGSLG